VGEAEVFDEFAFVGGAGIMGWSGGRCWNGSRFGVFWYHWKIRLLGIVLFFFKPVLRHVGYSGKGF
jgi:hypothetical protein